MVTELKLMQLAMGDQKIQVHDHPLFPCSAYFTDWRTDRIEGVPWHWHPELEFMTVTEGSADVRLGMMDARLHPGDGFFCNARVLHQISMAECDICRVRSFVFDPQLLTGGFGTIFDIKYLHFLTGTDAFPGMILRQKAHGEILAHVQNAYAACAKEPYGFEFDVRYHLSKALLRILRAHAADPAGGEKSDPQLQRVRDMLEYIRQNYASDLRIADLARAEGICNREVQRCFQNVLKQTPMDYIQAYRIQMASQMLMDTNASVLDVGVACGFSNASHFTQVFRKHLHVTPRKYRELHAGKAR